tara:strand:- start:2658 stop:2870 length:213 start_codon:yes stop_codon:yes gene_type:complete
MELNDLFAKNRYSADKDNSVIKLKDTRKTRLTLEQINKMRRIQEAKKFETYEKMKRVKAQYGSGDQGDSV